MHTAAPANSAPTTNAHQIPAQFDRLVFMVIDGMRYDFIRHMPWTSEYLRLSGRQDDLSETAAIDATAYVTYAHPPTVTMPRLRAMMTGEMPYFLRDIIENLMEGSDVDSSQNRTYGSQFTMDSVLSRLKELHANRKVHLFGDMTWMRLFGRDGFSSESYGTTSLFVKDTVEVDRNVTTNVFSRVDYNESLSTYRGDWCALVMHYLGLDHVGHCGELHSPRMHEKLREMDDVVKRLSELYILDQKSSQRTLIVVCSDHGMTDQGNHGGASNYETDAFAIFLAQKGYLLKYNLGEGELQVLDDVYQNLKWDAQSLVWRAKSGQSGLSVRVNQIDLAPTLSLLLGTYIPSQSIGKILPLLFTTQPGLLTSAMYKNFEQLSKTNYPDAATSVKNFDFFALADLSSKLTKEATNRDQTAIFFALVCLGLGAVLSLVLGPGKILGGMFASSASAVVSGFLAYFVLHVLCYKYLLYSMICSHGWSLLSSAIVACLVFLVTTFCCGVRSTNSCLSKGKSFETSIYDIFSCATSLIGWIFSISVFLGYLVAILSSSLIEEEHRLWYNICATCCVLLVLATFSQQYQKIGWLYIVCSILLLVSSRVMQSYNVSGIRYSTEYAALPSFLSASTVMWLHRFSVAAVLVFDTSRSLLCSKSKIIHIVFCLLLGSSLVLVSAFKTGFPSLAPYSAGVSSTAQLAYVLIGLHAVVSAVLSLFVAKYQRTRFVLQRWSMSLLALLLLVHRTEYAALVLAVAAHLHAAAYLIESLGLARQEYNIGWLVTSAIMSIGMSSFFAFGRSISIATVDFAGAYTGLDSFQPLIVFVLSVILQYGGTLLALLVLIPTVLDRGSAMSPRLLAAKALGSLLSVRLFILFLLCVTLYMMQDHLFIWSVFSPKFVHELGWTAFWSIASLLWLLVAYERAGTYGRAYVTHQL